MNIKFWRRGKPDIVLIVIVGILLFIGFLTLLSASAPVALAESGNSYAYFRKQLSYAIIGLVFAILVSKINYQIFKNKKILMLIYFVCVALAISVKFLGIEDKGAIRWIVIPGTHMTFQPSEFIKIGMIVWTAGYLANLKEEGLIKNPLKGIIIPLVANLFVCGLIFYAQNHFSAALLIALTAVTQLFIAGVNWKYFFGTLAAGSLLGLAAVAYKFTSGAGGFRQERIKVWLSPFDYIKQTGWQTSQGLYALASGGLFGVGLGNSKQKQSYIPEPQNDFIFAIFAEEMGYLAVIAVIGLFIALLYRCSMIATKAQDLFGKLIAFGITTILGLQIIGNLAVVSNTVPVTGISLPFFSYGGTSIITIFIMVGLLLSISKVEEKKPSIVKTAMRQNVRF